MNLCIVLVDWLDLNTVMIKLDVLVKSQGKKKKYTDTSIRVELKRENEPMPSGPSVAAEFRPRVHVLYWGRGGCAPAFITMGFHPSHHDV